MVQTHNLVLLALFFFAVFFIGAQSGAIAVSDESHEQTHTDRDLLLVDADEETSMWPYTSRDRAFHTKTLGINVIFQGDTGQVRRALLTQTDSDWNDTTSEFEDVDVEEDPVTIERNGTDIEWQAASGATRYTYVAYNTTTDEGPVGYWMAESGQLHDGEYLGTRHHIRLYEPRGEDRNWVAAQAHQEHWDWFTLRHSVDSNERAQQHIEEEFMGRWFIEDVRREYHGTTDAIDTDGWVTHVDMRAEATPSGSDGDPDEEATELDEESQDAAALMGSLATVGALLVALGGTSVAGIASALSLLAVPSAKSLSQTKRRVRFELELLSDTVDLRYLVLFWTTFGVLLFVRSLGVYLETSVSLVTPGVIVMGCYPLIVVGVPLCAYLPALRLDELQSFVTASGGIATGIMVDYALLGVAVLPVEVLVHRLGVVLAIGLIAAGAAETFSAKSAWNTPLRMGVLLWTGIVLAPHLS